MLDVMDRITTIGIPPKAWDGAREPDRNEYETTASQRGVELRHDGGESPTEDLLVAQEDGDGNITLVPEAYNGPVACQRAPWEHRLRQLLEMDDPCF